ncbi:MAG: hypothetical protein ACP5IB_05455 [Thermoplasmata archaeon]
MPDLLSVSSAVSLPINPLSVTSLIKLRSLGNPGIFQLLSHSHISFGLYILEESSSSLDPRSLIILTSVSIGTFSLHKKTQES